MNQCQWRRKIPTLIALVLAVPLFLLMMPLGMESLYAQTTLSEVMATPEGDQMKSKKISQKKGIPLDELNRGVPRSSVREFFNVTAERDFEKAAEFLDLRNLPQELKDHPGSELARQLRIVLAQTFWVDIDTLSDDPRGHMNDGLPSFRDRMGKIQDEGKSYDILLQRVPRGDGKFIWKFSNRTVSQIPALYELFGYGLLDHVFPAWFFDYQLFEIYIWEWVAAIFIMLFSFLLVWGITNPIIYLLQKKKSVIIDEMIATLKTPARLYAWVLLGSYFFSLVNISLVARAVIEAGTLRHIFFGWLMLRGIDFLFLRLANYLKNSGQPGATVLLPALSNVLKVIGVMAVVIFWLDNIGVKVTTLIAGLGIGGLAVALAAQKSLENIIGAIMLYTSRPVKIGDYCRIGDKSGTVEEIGLRSSKLRTLDHTIIDVPNAEFSSVQIENYSVRDRLWYHPQIRLRYETTPDQLRYILVEVRKTFYSHPKVLPDPARIRFAGFGEYSLNLEVFAYIDVNNVDHFLEVAEDLNLRIMDIVAQAGTDFAIPAQALHLQRGKGLSEEEVQRAEQTVKKWKEDQSLYLPSFPQEKIQELKGTLDYPPIGSSEAVPR